MLHCKSEGWLCLDICSDFGIFRIDHFVVGLLLDTKYHPKPPPLLVRSSDILFGQENVDMSAFQGELDC